MENDLYKTIPLTPGKLYLPGINIDFSKFLLYIRVFKSEPSEIGIIEEFKYESLGDSLVFSENPKKPMMYLYSKNISEYPVISSVAQFLVPQERDVIHCFLYGKTKIFLYDFYVNSMRLSPL